ncbi:signal peptidase I [Actinomyces howellii]|uniref:Signal peptidase I n=1 Tax=Actinomyces howellii TaxID=52771 RepID=A0A448HF88_9ACTO|nr:signal peptidase I [Actinomyces howellii]VEG26942.1 Signal peptidase I S [Actinomyces howellii]
MTSPLDKTSGHLDPSDPAASSPTTPGASASSAPSPGGAEGPAPGAASPGAAGDAGDPEDGALPPSFPPTTRPEPLPVPGSEPPRPARRRGSTLLVVVVVLVLTALIKTFVLQTFEIPSASMEPTLMTGDRVIVTVYDAGQVERGDVVVFADPGGWLHVEEPTGLRGAVQDTLELLRLLPQDTGHHLIKRVIGLPGDHIVATGQGPITVNGVTIDETYLPEGMASSETAFEVTVPEDCVWVMGDNRTNSMDSRFHRDDAHGGAVPLEQVVGVTKAVLWPPGRAGLLEDPRSVFSQVPAPSSAQ